MFDFLILIIIGFCIRVVIWGVLLTLIKKLKRPPTLHPIFGVAAIMHYWIAAESYAQYDYVNVWTVTGFVIPELLKLRRLKV